MSKTQANTSPQTALALKASIASPTFTGTPAAPTAAVGTNTTQLATTAFVLANAYFTLTATAPISSPADATTYYIGMLNQSNAPGTTAAARQGIVPMNCTLIGYAITSVSNTGGSSESSTVSVRINNTTDVTLSSAVTFNASGFVTNGFSSMGLSTNFTAGDKWEIKWLTPTWVTNPVNAGLSITLFFVTR